MIPLDPLLHNKDSCYPIYVQFDNMSTTALSLGSDTGGRDIGMDSTFARALVEEQKNSKRLAEQLEAMKQELTGMKVKQQQDSESNKKQKKLTFTKANMIPEHQVSLVVKYTRDTLFQTVKYLKGTYKDDTISIVFNQFRIDAPKERERVKDHIHKLIIETIGTSRSCVIKGLKLETWGERDNEGKCK